jgi:hypothetical protein
MKRYLVAAALAGVAMTPAALPAAASAAVPASVVAKHINQQFASDVRDNAKQVPGLAVVGTSVRCTYIGTYSCYATYTILYRGKHAKFREGIAVHIDSTGWWWHTRGTPKLVAVW